MNDDRMGISFHETMTGPFALGETDPQAGAERGRAAGSMLSIHCAVDINDLARFIADPEHAGNISGDVSFAPFGDPIPAIRGVFNLFSPTADPTCKYMVYELAFEHGGQAYYLAGHKEVREGPVTDVWRDTTTLYTQLHQGTDRRGPVIGAGVLVIEPGELAGLVASMRVTQAQSVADDVRALARFGRFFLGELWDTYGKR